MAVHSPDAGSGAAMVRVEHVSKQFGSRVPLSGTARVVHAVTDVSFTVDRAEVVAIVGETGSGKSTLGNCISGLLRPSAGQVWFETEKLTDRSLSRRSELRRKIQPVFQDPRSSLDPRWPVHRTIREPLDAYRIGTAAQRREQVAALMDRVGLASSLGSRYPHQLSGGQQQRVAIAAALALEPDLLVADEPVSALDVSVQAQILNLFESLRADLGLAVLFISHDLSVVHYLSDRVLVMYAGRVVESGTVTQVFEQPVHPYTKALLDAIPAADPNQRHVPPPLKGEIAAASSAQSGCVFASRCPEAIAACSTTVPDETLFGPGHLASCLVAAGRRSGEPAFTGAAAAAGPETADVQPEDTSPATRKG